MYFTESCNDFYCVILCAGIHILKNIHIMTLFIGLLYGLAESGLGFKGAVVQGAAEKPNGFQNEITQ